MGVCESKELDDMDDLLYVTAERSEVGASMMELETVEGQAHIITQIHQEALTRSAPENESEPLVTAAYEGDLSRLRDVLMDSDTPVDLVATTGRHKGKSAILAACEGGHAELVEALVRARAKLDTQSELNYEGRRRIASTPLLQASYQFIKRGLSGDIKNLKALLTAKVSCWQSLCRNSRGYSLNLI